MRENQVIGTTVHLYDGNTSGVSDNYETSLAQLTDAKEVTRRRLAAAESEVARLKQKLSE